MTDMDFAATLRDTDKGSGVTAEQLCERTGLSRSAVCNKLKRLIRTQKVRVTSGLITNAVGRQQETFLYHWRKESKR